MNEIFISYCTDDNVALAWEQLGWVDLFQDTLKKRLNVYCGRRGRPDIWFDKRGIEGNALLRHTIEAALKDAQLLVAVISPSYVTSEWCRTELETFLRLKREASDSSVHGRSRVLKTVKIPLEDDPFLATIPEFAECRGYDFYRLTEGRPPAELNPLRNPENSGEFTDAVDKLAASLLDTLGLVAQQRRSGLTIFLAESSRDMAADVDLLRKELEMFGHTIVRPPSELPDDEIEYRNALREIVAPCRLSIHPVGKFYGAIPEGYECSPLALQYAVAVEEAQRRAEFAQLAWMLPALETKDEKQRAFIATLEAQGPGFHRMSLEDFKTRVRDVLAPAAVPAARPLPTPAEQGEARTVYLVCDQHDNEQAVRAVSDILSRRYAVASSLLEREIRELAATHRDDLEAMIRADHEANLASCDGVIIYHAQGDQLWLRQKLREVRNARGYGRSGPFLARAVLLAAPATRDKQTFENGEVLILKAFGDLARSILEPFHEAMMRTSQQAV